MGPATADEQVGRVVGLPALRHHRGDAHQAADLEGPRNQLGERVELQRLQQVLIGPEAHRLDGGGGGPVPGDEDDGDLGGDLVDSPEYLQAGLVRQVDVQDHHVGPVESHPLQSLGRRRGRHQVGLRPGKSTPEEMEDRLLVVDDQQGGHGETPLEVSRVSRVLSGGSGQTEHEAGTAFGTVRGHEISAVVLGDPPRDGQAQAQARWFATDECLEDPWQE